MLLKLWKSCRNRHKHTFKTIKFKSQGGDLV